MYEHPTAQTAGLKCLRHMKYNSAVRQQRLLSSSGVLVGGTGQHNAEEASTRRRPLAPLLLSEYTAQIMLDMCMISVRNMIHGLLVHSMECWSIQWSMLHPITWLVHRNGLVY
jgi:hypothetical protein